MAKGSIAKECIIKKIMESFPEAFVYGKELRIPWEENGERVEIKVGLTCAKETVGGKVEFEERVSGVTKADENNIVAPTEEELRTVEEYMKSLGI